jgi:hypothetical protein
VGIALPTRSGDHRSPLRGSRPRTDCSIVRVLPSSTWVPGVPREGFEPPHPHLEGVDDLRRAGEARAPTRKGDPPGRPQLEPLVRGNIVTSKLPHHVSQGQRGASSSAGDVTYARHAGALAYTTLRRSGAA